MFNANEVLEKKKQLEEELKKLNQELEQNKEVIASYEKAIEEVNKVKEKYKFSEEEFIDLLHMNFKKTEKMVWVKVGNKAEKWPATRRGALSGDLEKVIKEAGFEKYKEYVAKFTLTEEEAKKLNEAQ
ncbi:TPA: hypothetical protein NOS69_000014 [Pseudomonas aeruginosa]|nr:hypothetical protein [Pseudomonas aeruginosa]